jgi:hypothetical protein
LNVVIFRARHDDIVFARTKCKYMNPHRIYMFTVTPLAWTYSSLVASEMIQREKQSEDKGRIQSTGEVVVSSTGNERHDRRRHHSYLRSRFNLVSEIRARLGMKFCWRMYKDVEP